MPLTSKSSPQPNTPARLNDRSGKITAPLLYLDAVRSVLDHLESTQLPAVETAAELVVHALRNKGAVYCWEIGHGIQHDFTDRAGGLAAIKPFTFSFNVPDPLPDCLKKRPRADSFDHELETIRMAVRAGNLRAGDVLLLGSVSGRNSRPVELALACRECGVKVIGFTSMAYTAKVESVHPSGKKLCDVADVVIDNGAPYGDAAVEIAGLDRSALPVSGVGMAVAGWMIWGRVIETMAAAGDPPTVFMSLNREGGKEIYAESVAMYQSRGY
jgi:uncharacterized phosphosugar-binding protein